MHSFSYVGGRIVRSRGLKGLRRTSPGSNIALVLVQVLVDAVDEVGGHLASVGEV